MSVNLKCGCHFFLQSVINALFSSDDESEESDHEEPLAKKKDSKNRKKGQPRIEIEYETEQASSSNIRLKQKN